MFRRSCASLCAAGSAAFSNSDGAGSGNAPGSRYSATYFSASERHYTPKYPDTRPTEETYRAMTDDQLVQLLQTRDKQIEELRAIYENMHYTCDKRFRTMVLDYHDRAAQLSQVHGQMQLGSLQITRETLVKLREQQEGAVRDFRLVVIISTVLSLVYWMWVRRHYINPVESEKATLARSVTGFGGNGNVFGSHKRSARSWETSWEREVREKKEKEMQDAKAATNSGSGSTTPSTSTTSA